MVADASVVIAHHAVHDAGEAGDTNLQATLLADLARDGLPRRLAELHEPAGQAPLAGRRLAAAPDEEHARAVEDDGAHAHARLRGIFAAHAPRAARGSASSHASVPYLSATSASTCAVSSSDRPPGASVRPCSRSKAATSAAVTSSKEGRRPVAAS